MLLTDSGTSDFEQAPTGTELGICIKVIDLGTQQGEYQGKVTHKRQILVSWELPNSLMTEGDAAGKPFIVSKFYTASLNEKSKLRHDLVSWRGREFTDQELAGFDARNILGKPCMLGLISNTKGKTIVSSVMAVMKGMPTPQPVNPLLFFSMWPGQFDPAVYDKISDGIKTKFINLSPEYQELARPAQMKDVKPIETSSGFEDFEDSIPF